MKFTILISVLLLSLVGFTGCDAQATENSTDAQQAVETEGLVAEADRQAGMPNVVNFTERKLMKLILELRDQEGLSTWTYIVNLEGKLVFLTESIGYGLPYSTQYTNPERLITGGRHATGYWSETLPQPDPNGLFMPTGLSATWILSATESGLHPMYVEPEIIVSATKLH